MQKIGRYEIVEELGRGSMGVVFKALDPQIGRDVAIKIILTANLPKEESELYRSRFYREAQAAGKMSHPGIVTIHDIAEDEMGQPFLVMEYVEGPTLHKMLRPDAHGKIRERMPLERTLDLCAQVADALDYAHGRGVVHRDIKPSNIIVAQDGRAKIADFGIARLSGAEATHTATVTGTPAYMSPEQFRGGIIDKRSDIFSLGAMLYWMCTGEKPFPGENVTQVSFNVVYREPAAPRQLVPELPADMEVVLSRCLAKRTENRYETAADVAADLRAVGEGKAVSASAAPPEATVEDTVVTMPNITPVGMSKVKQAAKKAAEADAATRRRVRTQLVVGLLMVVGVAAGGWWWNRALERAAALQNASSPGPVVPQKTTGGEGAPAGASDTAKQSVPPSPASTAPPAVSTNPTPVSPSGDAGAATTTGVPASSTKAPASSAPVAPPARTAAPPMRGATMAVDCQHGFKDATIEISANGRPFYQGKLEGKPAAFGRTAGRWKEDLAVSPGNHRFVVRVTSTASKYIEEEEITGDFAAGQTRTLEIRFGRGFGHNLTLKWKK